jgi:uncharacterized protein YndB with AHSA1/START domain
MLAVSTDRIEKSSLIRAPRERVWQALANAEKFGKWFGVDLTGRKFAPGATVRGPVTHEAYRHVTFEATIQEMEPGRRLSWRWHPYAVDPNRDYSGEPTTLVVFELADAPGGTMLTVVESGFDRIPIERRDEAFRSNESGWAQQMVAIEKYVGAAA